MHYALLMAIIYSANYASNHLNGMPFGEVSLTRDLVEQFATLAYLCHDVEVNVVLERFV